MKPRDLIAIVTAFNDCINNRDIKGLADLMADSHIFIDRDGTPHGPKSFMVDGWGKFFRMFPHYKNNFTEIKEVNDEVHVIGYAFWSEEESYDPVIWTAKFEDSLISEWRVYEDTEESRRKFNFKLEK